MTSRISEPIDRLTFDAARLMAEHPPIWRDPGGRGSGDNLRTAIDLIKGDLATAGGMKSRNLIDQIAGLGFDWGVSDGN